MVSVLLVYVILDCTRKIFIPNWKFDVFIAAATVTMTNKNAKSHS